MRKEEKENSKFKLMLLETYLFYTYTFIINHHNNLLNALSTALVSPFPPPILILLRSGTGLSLASASGLAPGRNHGLLEPVRPVPETSLSSVTTIDGGTSSSFRLPSLDDTVISLATPCCPGDASKFGLTGVGSSGGTCISSGGGGLDDGLAESPPTSWILIKRGGLLPLDCLCDDREVTSP